MSGSVTPCTRCTEKPNNTKMLGVWNREKFTAGPCKEVGDSCLKTPKLPKSKSRSVMSQLFVTPWAVAHQAPLSMKFSTPEYWGGLPFRSPGDLSNPGIELRSPILQADSLPADPSGKLPKSFQQSHLVGKVREAQR